MSVSNVQFGPSKSLYRFSPLHDMKSIRWTLYSLVNEESSKLWLGQTILRRKLSPGQLDSRFFAVFVPLDCLELGVRPLLNVQFMPLEMHEARRKALQVLHPPCRSERSAFFARAPSAQYQIRKIQRSKLETPKSEAFGAESYSVAITKNARIIRTVDNVSISPE
ncbi:hypothetical protein EDC04DRAFT_2716575 [Pisolithus marmoratus]|nr:hypothetical protein EDC04DRAFT_2716575 [Pisolithus marmoratus]